MKAFIARDSDGDLYLYTPKPPIKGAEIWVSICKIEYNTYNTFKIDNDLFPDVKWEDEEPTEVSIEIVGKKSQQPQE